MKLQKFALTVAAAGFAGFGLVLFIAPGLLESAGVAAVTKSGSVELRAFYGGIELGLAAFFALAVKRPEWTFPALAALVLTMTGIVLLRGFALLITGFQANAVIYLSWVVEIVLFAIALLALIRHRS